MSDVSGTPPDPSQPSSSLGAGDAAHPSVKSKKISESFIPLMSRMDRKQFNSNDVRHPAAYDSENNYGKI